MLPPLLKWWEHVTKPEKAQLTCDHKDLDPAKILSKIEVTLKDRNITHKYDAE